MRETRYIGGIVAQKQLIISHPWGLHVWEILRVCKVYQGMRFPVLLLLTVSRTYTFILTLTGSIMTVCLVNWYRIVLVDLFYKLLLSLWKIKSIVSASKVFTVTGTLFILVFFKVVFGLILSNVSIATLLNLTACPFFAHSEYNFGWYCWILRAALWIKVFADFQIGAFNGRWNSTSRNWNVLSFLSVLLLTFHSFHYR